MNREQGEGGSPDEKIFQSGMKEVFHYSPLISQRTFFPFPLRNCSTWGGARAKTLLLSAPAS